MDRPKTSAKTWKMTFGVECTITVEMPGSTADVAMRRAEAVLDTYLGLPTKVKVSGIKKKIGVYAEVSDQTVTLEIEPERA